MQNPGNRIFQILLARQEAAHAYDRVVHLYTMGGSSRTIDCFDTPREDIVLDDLITSDDLEPFTSAEICNAIDELEEDGKVVIDNTVTPARIKLMPIGGNKCTKH